ncbi:hypothetical protein Q7P37_001296 [Cladosporium fusiforme]
MQEAARLESRDLARDGKGGLRLATKQTEFDRDRRKARKARGGGFDWREGATVAALQHLHILARFTRQIARSTTSPSLSHIACEAAQTPARVHPYTRTHTACRQPSRAGLVQSQLQRTRRERARLPSLLPLVKTPASSPNTSQQPRSAVPPPSNPTTGPVTTFNTSASLQVLVSSACDSYATHLPPGIPLPSLQHVSVDVDIDSPSRPYSPTLLEPGSHLRLNSCPSFRQLHRVKSVIVDVLLTYHQARVARRAVTDENVGATTRVTRAKAAALETSAGDPPKKALTTKRTTTAPANGAVATRKRAALGDVSNVAKNDAAETADAKKGALGKNTLASKTAKPTGVTKPAARATTTSTRTALSAKPAHNGSSELKRPASGSGVGGPVVKKRNTSTTKPAPILDVDEEVSENVPPPKNGAVAEKTKSKTIFTSKDLALDDEELDHKTLEELSKEAKDLDSEDLDDPLMVAEYVHEIFDYMKKLEIATLPNPDYMDSQDELEWKMRGILVDWLLEVHTRFRLLPETLFLAVNIIDRFLSCKVVQLDRLQLVGVTAMFIASKYEEVLSPHVQNFKHVADDGFTEAEILQAERFVLGALDYDLSYPNPMNFLRRISKADNYDIQTRTLGKYLLEIGCLDHRFLQYPPSHVAAAAMYLARAVLERGEWDATLAHYAGYTEHDIQPVFKLMVDYLHGPVVHDAFFRKYASKKFLKASIILRQWAKKNAPKYLDNVSEASSGKTPRS